MVCVRVCEDGCVCDGVCMRVVRVCVFKVWVRLCVLSVHVCVGEGVCIEGVCIEGVHVCVGEGVY